MRLTRGYQQWEVGNNASDWASLSVLLFSAAAAHSKKYVAFRIDEPLTDM